MSTKFLARLVKDLTDATLCGFLIAYVSEKGLSSLGHDLRDTLGQGYWAVREHFVRLLEWLSALGNAEGMNERIGDSEASRSLARRSTMITRDAQTLKWKPHLKF